MSKNFVTVRGNLVDDPYFGFVQGANGSVPLLRFTIAIDRHPPRPGGTDYIQVCSYGPRAAADFAFLQQGSLILVDGWIRSRNGTDSAGAPMTRVEIVGEEITFLHNIDWERGNAALAAIKQQQAA